MGNAVTVRTLALACLMSVASVTAAFQSPLEEPARPETRTRGITLIGATQADQAHWLAVGSHGLVLSSTDAGVSWQQGRVPVGVDLVAVNFPSPRRGWAVGHGGVVLNTIDAGASWQRQFNGQQAADLAVAFYQALLAQQTPPDAKAQAWLSEAEYYRNKGTSRPFLDLWFENDLSGFIVGPYNTLFHTADGGQSWEPWSHRVDNPQALNLHAIRGIGDDLVLIGEQGLLLKLDRATQRFVALPPIYDGSFFGIAGRPDLWVVYGIRGNAFASRDTGRTWQRIETGTRAPITGAVLLGGERLALVTGNGELLVGEVAGTPLRAVPTTQAMAYSAVLPGAAGELLLFGNDGVQVQPLSTAEGAHP